jgi:16S rRNA G966 N2-methylase RsmD
MKFQANVPFKLTKLFYEKLGEQPKDKRVLVIRDLFTAMHASIDNAVTFVTDDEEACELFNKNVVSNDEFGNNDTAIFVDTEINKNAWKDFIKELSSMPKFDVAIMNPPYDGSLHLKLLENIIPIANKVVNISPVRWLQDPLTKYKKNSDYNKFEESISKKIESLDVIDAKLGNNLFQIANFGALGIYRIGNGGYDYESVAKDYLGDAYSICNKALQCNDKISNHIQKGTAGICVKVAAVRGFGSGKNFDIVSLIHSVPYIDGNGYKEKKFKKKDVMTKDIECEFFVRVNSVEEGTNFINSTRTTFHHFLIKCLKMNQHVPLNFLPYMQDYTQPWDDKRFCEYFGITGYISDTEAEPNSEWEIILNTMKEYE